MAFDSLESILEVCREKQTAFWEAVLLDDMNERNAGREESWEQMKKIWSAMKEAAAGYDGSLRSNSGLVGGAGQQMEEYVRKGDTLCGPFVGQVIAGALQMGESNACMKRIVAAPTAGACGVLPAVLVPCFRERGVPEETILEALYTAAGIGQVIALRASIAGASGGCQAEIGTASAMAAGALVHLQGRKRRADHPRGSHGPEEPAGPGMRSGSGAGGGSLCQTECGRRRDRPVSGGYGSGRDPEQDSAGSGD